MIKLRPYQEEAIKAVLDYWQECGRNPLVDLATGTGKSILLASLIKQLLADYPSMHFLMLTHVKELVAQNFTALLKVWPDAPAGICSAGLNRRDVHHRITFASIQSVYKKAKILGVRDLICIDEAHLVPKKGEGMYRRLLDDLYSLQPDARVVGFTATPYRLDSGRLDEGSEKLFDKVVYTYDIARGIEDGYLSPLISKATAAEIDVSKVERRGGEFVPASLEGAADAITLDAVAEIINFGRTRKSWLIFCSGVKHAYHVRDILRMNNVSCETVTGKTPNGERDSIIRRFKNGEIKALTNANVLTTGFDVAQIDLVAMLRPTLSTSLYVQIVGRGTRLAPGKENCIAEGQRVLTDKGLVPIEKVTTDMRVWDGFSFVSHSGTVCHGEKNVITYSGLTATPDHKVWTEKGWKTFGECAFKQIAIAVTGNGSTPIRKTEGCYRKCCSKKERRQTLSFSRMSGLQDTIIKGIHQPDTYSCRMPSVRQSKKSPEVACNASNSSKAAMYQSKRYGIRTIRQKRNKVLFLFTNANGCLDSAKSWIEKRYADRSHKQRWSLRSGKFEIFHTRTKSITYNKTNVKCKTSSIPKKISRYQVCRHNPSTFNWGRPFRKRNYRQISPEIPQTKRRVWDILNAGQFHRFTIEGLLVHNCLVLDFAGNVRRHGPVDAISVLPKEPGNKAGSVNVDDVRAKECPDCHELVALNTRTCKWCGYGWPYEEKPKHEARAEAHVGILSTEKVPPQMVPVVDWELANYWKPGSHSSMKVAYFAGISFYTEWIAFEHGGYAGRKAQQWWIAHGGNSPSPKTTSEALGRCNELAMPATISVKPRGKYFDIVGRSFARKKEIAG